MAFLNATRNITLVLRPATSETTTTIIQDPFDFGYEGRVAISRELSRRRAGITAALTRYTSRIELVPHSLQYQYLLSHGYYTTEELKDHPGRPLEPGFTSVDREDTIDAQWKIAENRRMIAQSEYLAKKEEKRWQDREARLRRWRASFDDSTYSSCHCRFCMLPGPRPITTDW